jgi:hypothetical protein
MRGWLSEAMATEMYATNLIAIQAINMPININLPAKKTCLIATCIKAK